MEINRLLFRTEILVKLGAGMNNGTMKNKIRDKESSLLVWEDLNYKKLRARLVKKESQEK